MKNPIIILLLVGVDFSPSIAKSQVQFSSSNLPIFVINTQGKQIRDEVRIPAHLGIIDHGKEHRNALGDPYNGYDGWIAIERRGSATGNYPKGNYRFETQDEQGNNLNVSLLGMPEENDWILYGPYTDDPSLIRNVLAYRWSMAMGRYASRVRFCEVVLNGDYQGIYVLMEKIKRDKNRVDISELDADDLAGDSLTGGYIIKIDKWEGENVGGWWSQSRIFYQYHYPQQDDIQPQQISYIRNFMNAFENAMKSDTPSDSLTGYSKYIDLDSFVDHFILNEVCKNVDAYRISAFFYKDRDSKKKGKLHAGPIWDFNLTLGRSWFPQDRFVTEGWQVDYGETHPWDDYQVPFFWNVLVHQPEFAERVLGRWKALRKGIFALDSMSATIDRLVDTVSEARIRNLQRWPEMDDEFSYEEEIRRMKEWIAKRTTWIDNHLGLLAQVHEKISIIREEAVILYPNYPNPFNTTTRVRFFVFQPCKVDLGVYTLRGERIRTLYSGQKLQGEYTLVWDGKTDSGISISSGTYFIQLKTEKSIQTQKIIFLK